MAHDSLLTDIDLTDRQRRERDYHRDFAARHAPLITQAVDTDVIAERDRRWWNAYWTMYDHILAADLAGKRVLVPGCGFGGDAMLLRMLGAVVSGFDISEEVIAIARQRAARFSLSGIDYQVMAAERLAYPDASFDAVVCVNILHHVDIALAMAEVARVLKLGGLLIGQELYSHSSLQRIRESRPISRSLYPRMQQWIYGTAEPYITDDEHKIDEAEFALVADHFAEARIDYFACLEGRLFPSSTNWAWASRLDRRFLQVAGLLAPVFGSRVVFRGSLRR